MNPYYQDNQVAVYNSDCRNMSELADETVQMVCTSPPYWGLRKYAGLPDLIWGGDKDCEHQWERLPSSFKRSNQRVGSSTMAISPKLEELNATRDNSSSFCSLCGAWRGAFGLEPTPDCGRPFMKLRDDLTPKQRDDTIKELKRLGVL